VVKRRGRERGGGGKPELNGEKDARRPGLARKSKVCGEDGACWPDPDLECLGTDIIIAFNRNFPAIPAKHYSKHTLVLVVVTHFPLLRRSR
jgi:hypothetical protein